MDRTSQIGVFVCAILLFVLYFTTTPPAHKPAHKPNPTPTPAAAATTAAANSTSTQAVNATLATTPAVPLVEKIDFLENPAVRVTFTSSGAAIKEVLLKQHKEGAESHVVLNANAKQNILALTGWTGTETPQFQVTDSQPNQLVYTTDLSGGVKWTRTYTFGKAREARTGLGGILSRLFRHIAQSIGKPEPPPMVYTLNVTDSLSNPGTADATLPAYGLSVGRTTPLLVGGHYQPISNQFMGAGWLTTKFRLTTVTAFDPGFIPLIGIKTSDGRDLISSLSIDNAPLEWLGMENQFFAVLLTPAKARSITHATFQCYNARDEYGKVPYTAEPDIEANAFFPAVTIPAGNSLDLHYTLYAGPKEYDRLNALGAMQGELMNYGMFEILIVPMLFILHSFHIFVGSYGVAIILLTLLIKAITWPLQSIANRSGKRMQALAPKLKELQAKFKDQPEKLQTETFAMYRDYGVNPFGGCLPALIQMPVFFSLYFMLQNAVELRGQSFFWVHDLTQPDTVWSFPLPFALPFGFGDHFMLNPLPLIVTGLTMVMMRMTPQIGDPQQAKIAQWMPLIFLFIFYNFAAALSLYYVINNGVSIIQIYRNLKKPMPELKRIPRKKTT